MIISLDKAYIFLTIKEWGNYMEAKRLGKAVIYGFITILIFGIISSFGFALLLKFTNMSEITVGYLILATSFFAFFMGGLISGAKGKRTGWALGALVGILYVGTIFLFQYLGLELRITLKQGTFNLAFILISLMGGILGVNMTSKK